MAGSDEGTNGWAGKGHEFGVVAIVPAPDLRLFRRESGMAHEFVNPAGG
jgi:hypothetical protein